MPPDLQPEVARHALALGKPVFVEKPLAADLAGARAMVSAAQQSGRPTIIDFNFPELPSWQRAKAIIARAARLGDCVTSSRPGTWRMRLTRLRLKSWKTRAAGWGRSCSAISSATACIISNGFAGRSPGLGGRLFVLPDGDAECSLALALAFASGAGGSLQMSCASYLGSGHRIELYGEDGTLVLANPTADYFRGFTLRHARRGRPLAGRDIRARNRGSLCRFAHRARLAAGASISRCLRERGERRRPASPRVLACSI